MYRSYTLLSALLTRFIRYCQYSRRILYLSVWPEVGFGGSIYQVDSIAVISEVRSIVSTNEVYSIFSTKRFHLVVCINEVHSIVTINERYILIPG